MAHEYTNHHYVPIWLQKRFLLGGATAFKYLDMAPGSIVTPTGLVARRAVSQGGPSVCFCKKNLYSTYFAGQRNDDIETQLFGPIDKRGADGIRAISENDFNALHESLWSAYEFIDALKMRTPKGLDAIRQEVKKQRVPKHLNPDDLALIVMQKIRRSNVVMWAESVREVVSAANSTIKFLLTDHPVTIYNKAAFPGNRRCEYPNDAPVAWIGSQTILPIDHSHLLIFTHIQHAKRPERTSWLTTSRINARAFDQTLTRIDTIIHSRELSENDVIKVNRILKWRARRYIAAVDEDWLYPDRYDKKTNWDELGACLLPRDELWRYGGEVYVGGADGDLLWYQDAFGRRPPVFKGLTHPRTATHEKIRIDALRMLEAQKGRDKS